MERKKAFTLAEILITLTILGVVAAIAVPSLMKQQYKKTQIARMAKAYAILENAAQNIAVNTNCIGKDLECTGLLNSGTLQSRFAEYGGFKISKKESGGDFFMLPISYEVAPEGTKGIRLNAFITTPDGLAYSIQKINLYKHAPGKPNNLDRRAAIAIYVTTDKKVLYNESGEIFKSKALVKNAISGRNVFRFVMYDNFKVDPLCSVFGNQEWPLSSVNSGSAYFNKGSINEYCNPNKAHIESYNPGNDTYDSCTCRIVRDGWKMKY